MAAGGLCAHGRAAALLLLAALFAALILLWRNPALGTRLGR